MSTPTDRPSAAGPSTPAVFDEMRAKLAEHMANLSRASESAKLVRGEAESPDRELRVVVTSSGEIEELTISPAAMEHEPEALAQELKAILERARADVAAKVSLIFAEQGPPPITIGPAGDIDLRRSMDELGVGSYLRDAERLSGGPLI